MAKTKMESNSSKKNKKKKTKLSGPAAAAMKSSKQQPTRSNPFELNWTRTKFDVLGKKKKGEQQRLGLARSIAIQKRKNTLQVEYEESGKSSVFIDKRIGEKDDTLQEFDKAVLRLQRERQLKQKKNSKYNLDEGDDDDSAIHETHSLSEFDDFDEDVPLDDDYDSLTGTQNSSRYLSLHEGHGSPDGSLADGMENAHKTKKQVMSEIISKSKFYKAQKAKDKEEDDHLLEKLDQDFQSLAQKEALASLTQPNKMNALKALSNKSYAGQSLKEPRSSAVKEPLQNDKPDAYDKLVKEMALDMRARPSDRAKTPEEIAQEERERLEALEEERRKRMVASDESDDDENDGDEDPSSRSKAFRSISGDDLGDSFSVDEERDNRKGWVDDIYNNEDAGNQDEGNTSSEGSETDGEDDQDGNDSDDGSNDNDSRGDGPLKTSSLKDWEQSDDDDVGMDEEEDDENITENLEETTDSSKSTPSGKHATLKQEVLPYVIEAPNNLAEFSSLLDGRSDEEIVVAINRIRVCNSIKLAAENKRKMQVFYGVLLQYFAVLATKKPLSVRRLNSLVKPLIEMSVETPYFAAICARERLIHIRKQFSRDIKSPEKSSWPSVKTLLLFRLWSLTFPCSDFRHAVMTPVILLMCEYLIRCPIVSGRDIAIGSFLCSMVFSVAKQSQKFCPEAIIFLKTLLMSSLESEPRLHQPYQHHHLLELKIAKPWLVIHDKTSEVHPIDFLMVMDMELDAPFFQSDSFKTGILTNVVETLKGFIHIYKDLSSFSEIFLPVSSVLHEMCQKGNLPSLLQCNVKDVIDLINTKSHKHQMLRQPLQMRKEKLVPIKLLNPKFEESFVKGRDYDPDRERAERKKLKKKLKSEAKGAVRDLRKDNHFVYGLKEKERIQEEEDRAEKYGKARAFLQEQEHAFKSGQLGKGRKRRR